MKIPFTDLRAGLAPIREEIDLAIARVVDQTAFIGGSELEAFEREFAEYCGLPFAAGCSNGTDGIALALKALGIGPGDSVVVPAMSFIATAEAVSQIGAAVEFVDIEPGTLTLDPAALQRHLATRKGPNRVRAVVPVHLHGQMADMPAILAVAQEHGLKVVEDAAQAHGAGLFGRMPGQYGDAATFSFYPGKNLGAFGDAGAVVCRDAALHRRIKMLVNHGRWDAKYDHEIEGFNMRMDALQAAILRVKLRHLPAWTEARRTLAASLMNRLRGAQLALPVVRQGSRPVWHLFVVRTPDRDDLQARLKRAEIATGIHYPVPIPYLKAYAHAGHPPGAFPVAEAAASTVLSLPFWPEMNEEQVSSLVDALA